MGQGGGILPWGSVSDGADLYGLFQSLSTVLGPGPERSEQALGLCSGKHWILRRPGQGPPDCRDSST